MQFRRKGTIIIQKMQIRIKLFNFMRIKNACMQHGLQWLEQPFAPQLFEEIIYIKQFYPVTYTCQLVKTDTQMFAIRIVIRKRAKSFQMFLLYLLGRLDFNGNNRLAYGIRNNGIHLNSRISPPIGQECSPPAASVSLYLIRKAQNASAGC